MHSKQLPFLLALAIAGATPSLANASAPASQADALPGVDLSGLTQSIQERLALDGALSAKMKASEGKVLAQFASCFCNYHPAACPGYWWRAC